MIITNKFVMLNFPKTGSTFVRQALEELYQTKLKKSSISKYADRLNLLSRVQFQELRVPNHKIMGLRSGIKDHHGTYQQVPLKYRQREIVTVTRNPFDRYVSQYEFRWWATHPILDVDELKKRFPQFPDLTFEQYLEYTDMEIPLRTGNNDLGCEIGNQTVQFVQMYFKKGKEVLKEIDDAYIEGKKYLFDMPKIVFLRMEHLNEDLYSYLLSRGYKKNDIEFILYKGKVQPREGTRRKENSRWNDYFSEKLLIRTQAKEKLLFDILYHHGIDYRCGRA